jgi:hypothetical protein
MGGDGREVTVGDISGSRRSFVDAQRYGWASARWTANCFVLEGRLHQEGRLQSCCRCYLALTSRKSRQDPLRLQRVALDSKWNLDWWLAMVNLI